MKAAPLAVTVIAATLLTGCGGPSSSSSSTVHAETHVTSAPFSPPGGLPASQLAGSPAAQPVSSAPASPSALPVAPGAGALPQTRALPSPGSAAFKAAMHDLWLAVTTGKADLALPAFFPRGAYKQVKAIYDPAADWHGRLWYDFTLDVGAAHRVVGPGARLVRVIVPMSDAAWINPGVCANRLGYWHVSGARVVYREHGRERSFGIASLISWRGVWYVVHFGAVLRNVVTGIVDDPETGPGIAGPAGGC